MWTFTSWRSCLPEKISLNSAATKASRLISRYIILDFTQYNSLITTIPCLPFLTPTQHHFSLSTYYWPPHRVFALHSLFLYSDMPPSHPPSFWLAQAIFQPNLSPYTHPTYLIPVILPALHCLWRWNRPNVPKCQHIKFICRGIPQVKEYKIQHVVATKPYKAPIHVHRQVLWGQITNIFTEILAYVRDKEGCPVRLLYSQFAI